jgi:hypothetical protein
VTIKKRIERARAVTTDLRKFQGSFCHFSFSNINILLIYW